MGVIIRSHIKLASATAGCLAKVLQVVLALSHMTRGGYISYDKRGRGRGRGRGTGRGRGEGLEKGKSQNPNM